MPGIPGNLPDNLREGSLDLHLDGDPVDKKVQAVLRCDFDLPSKENPLLPKDLLEAVLKVFLRGIPEPERGEGGYEVRRLQSWLPGIQVWP